MEIQNSELYIFIILVMIMLRARHVWLIWETYILNYYLPYENM